VPPPSAVLFDIGDTLLEEQRFDLEAGINAVVANDAEVVLLAAEFRNALEECHAENREPLLAQWLQARVPALAAFTIPHIEDRIWRVVVTLVPRTDVSLVLTRLAADSVPVGAVSNAAFSGRVLRAELARHGLADSLRFVVSSADLDSRKPAALIFETAVTRLGVAASSTWFVGDTLSEDIAGAARAGLQPIWFSTGTEPASVPRTVPLVRSWPAFLTLYQASINAPAG
jgi:putative hydrolase of the HAD superfamily